LADANGKLIMAKSLCKTIRILIVSFMSIDELKADASHLTQFSGLHQYSEAIK
jgi:hypothetical protein